MANGLYYGDMQAATRPRVAVFASGDGSTFEACTDAIREGIVDFDIVLVITDRANAGVLQRVERLNKEPLFSIETAVINRSLYPQGVQGRGQTKAEAAALLQVLKQHNIDHLVLMGCLRIIADQVIAEYGWHPAYAHKDPKTRGMYCARLTNTHPGILPATADTFGIHTQKRVLDLGLAETAHTYHVLASGVDEGPIIAEHRVPVYKTDSPEILFGRVRRIEKAHLPLDLNAFLKAQAIYLRDLRGRTS